VSADYAKQLAGCFVSLPFLAQKLSSNVVLLFPLLDLLNKWEPAVIIFLKS
jgi:hypothetical protein